MKTTIAILAILLLAGPALAENLPGVNFKFSPDRSTGNSATYNPNYGWSYSFDNGSGGQNTRYPDGSWSYQIGSDQGQSITIDNRAYRGRQGSR